MKPTSKTTTGKLKKEETNPMQEEVKKDDPMPKGNDMPKDDAPAPPIEKATEEVQPNPLENPFWLMEKALEKKLRNLKKRQMRLQQMKAEKEDGYFMPKQQQIEALNKIDEIGNQIAFVEEMQKLNQKQFAQYKKAIKVRDRELKKQEKARSQTMTPLQTEQDDQQVKSPPQSEKEEHGTESEVKLEISKSPGPISKPESQPKMETANEKKAEGWDENENKENVPIAAVDNEWGRSGGGGW